MELPRRRKQTARYGGQDNLELSDLESTDSDASNASTSTITTTTGEIPTGKETRASTKKKRGKGKKNLRSSDPDNYSDEEFSSAGLYNRSDLFRVEKLVLVYG